MYYRIDLKMLIFFSFNLVLICWLNSINYDVLLQNNKPTCSPLFYAGIFLFLCILFYSYTFYNKLSKRFQNFALWNHKLIAYWQKHLVNNIAATKPAVTNIKNSNNAFIFSSSLFNIHILYDNTYTGQMLY